MDNLKGALECAKEDSLGAMNRFGEGNDHESLKHLILCVREMLQELESMRQWQAMLLELHKAREPMPGEGEEAWSDNHAVIPRATRQE